MQQLLLAELTLYSFNIQYYYVITQCFLSLSACLCIITLEGEGQIIPFTTSLLRTEKSNATIIDLPLFNYFQRIN